MTSATEGTIDEKRGRENIMLGSELADNIKVEEVTTRQK